MLESFAPPRIDVPLKSLMYFWDLNRFALSFTSLFNKTLDEFQTEAVVVVLWIELLFVVVAMWPDIDFVG